MQVRYGIVGVGGMGSGHAEALQSMKEARLAAVCDIVPQVAQSVGSKYGVPFCTDYHELVDRADVDAVMVATPHYFHPDITIYALERGKPVISEKPISVTVAEADRMVKAAKRTGTPFGVMYQTRTEPIWRAAREIVESGRLGELYRTMLVYADFRSQAYYNSAGWRATWSGEGGGVLINQAPHALDRFTLLGGLPSKITAYTATRNHDIEVEDTAAAMLEYPNGAIGYVYCSTTESPGSNILELSGEYGKLQVIGKDIHLWEIPEGVKGSSDSATEMWGDPKWKEMPVTLPECATGHAEILANMARHILHGEPLLSPGVDGLKTVEMINGIILSGKLGKAVDVPVDRAKYDVFLKEMVAGSKAKDSSADIRQTDHVH
ncbi:MAG: Gfo/Idh/MocA family oxidoreductase [Chloroflexi bacterium]|nr:Gfo/Idh/MocA family oxidoreductase [Chloroflexota bacterium]